MDVRNCPVDIFPLVNSVAARSGVQLTLLHVITLSILAPESRIYDELRYEAQFYLERIAKEYLHTVRSPDTRVRFGNLVDEVISEAKEADADLIILPSRGPSFWQRVGLLWKQPIHPFVSHKTRQIMDRAHCGLFIAPSQTRFDCERHWGRPDRQSLEPVNDIAGSEQRIGLGNQSVRAKYS
jgi:nucleotide-binding universal stress UspA family protein